ncbi:four-carbon acid sugar kinase family protein [Arcicella sp. LKC2W]|uniref:four-carbon acid sugar kinase family protein n=1 Tax=Arcicella sp. LKC2W TaxID=2984198 RepID=UPI002B1F06A7|nr:four-carbon acid sugar kinase family protein [Arcicella sp. LKC2W]MEA5460401.1 four-carbon acid sugar kinase family protein [Arcicella sp. LKC2W]
MKSPIIVIADDFTGAAEIAGIGLRYQLRVEIMTNLETDSQADLWVIAANTRSLTEIEAKKIISELSEQLLALKPTLIYKKIDSVLRGHILVEITEILQKTNHHQVLIVPTNPSLGRTIINGNYFVKGVLISETSFAHDPEFAIKSSHVLAMIKAENTTVQVLNTKDILPKEGIFIAEANTKEDIEYWVFQANQNTLLVGAADFFNAILAKYCQNNSDKKQVLVHDNSKFKNAKTLYVSGTTFGKSVQAIALKSQLDGSVSYLPEAFFSDKNEAKIIQAWANEILCLLQNHPSVIVAIGDLSDYDVLPTQLAKWMGLVVKKVLENSEIQELLIEGGATAAAILQTLSFTRFMPTNEFSQGVIRMKCQGETQTYLTIKPGSYEWSKEIWEF